MMSVCKKSITEKSPPNIHKSSNPLYRKTVQNIKNNNYKKKQTVNSESHI